jgi:uncharacterized iron-regulated membrane protein
MVRKTLFWIHLVAGLVCALPLLVVALTGVLLSVEPQVIDAVERDMRRVEVLPSADPVALDSLVFAARRVQAGKVTGVTVASGATQAAVVRFGKDGAVWVNPRTAEVQGTNTSLHAAFAWLERIHRWLGSREIGGKVTGVSVLLCLLLSITGMFLWWPRNLKALSQVVFPRRGLKGRARDWQWHNALGVLALPFLLVLSSTGAVMAWPWAESAMFRAMGSEPPKRAEPTSKAQGAKNGGVRQGAGEGGEGVDRKLSEEGRLPRFPMQEMLDTAMLRAPAGWSTATLRFSERPGAGSTVLFLLPDQTARLGTSVVLRPDGSFAEVKHPRADLAFRLRAILRPVHTGEQFGVLGQVLMAMAGLATMVLVWTGTAMSWRRFFARKRVEPT